MPSFGSDLLFVVVAAGMLGGFYLAGFFREAALAEAPERGGVVAWRHLLTAFGLWLLGGMASAPILSAVGLDPKSPTGQCAGYLAMFGGPLVLWLRLGLSTPENAERLGLRRRLNGRSWRVAVWGIPAGLVLVQGVGVAILAVWTRLGHQEPKAGHEVFKSMQEHPEAVGAMVVQAVLALLIAPLCEEALFRGLLQTGMQTMAPGGVSRGRARWVILLVVGLAFGAVHFGAVPVPMLPALVAFGILLGWAYEYTGCFWVPVMIHMGFNTVSFAAGVWQIRHA